MKGSPGHTTSVLVPALAYFGLVFGAGFVLGTVRVLVLVPRLGERVAELLELPVMVVAVVLAAGWTNRRFPRAAGRLGTGLVALALLLGFELLLVAPLQGRTVAEAVLDRDPVSGAAYGVSLVLFALMPWLLARGGAAPGTGDDATGG